MCDLSCEDVAEFIRKFDLDEKYCQAALENEVDGESIATMKDKQLRKLLEMNKDPIAFLQFKFKIKRAYKERNVGQLALDYPSQIIAKMCSHHDCLTSAVSLINKHDVDGEMIMEADEDVYKQISTDWQSAKDIFKQFIKINEK